jgi:uncharacterized protein YacL
MHRLNLREDHVDKIMRLFKIILAGIMGSFMGMFISLFIVFGFTLIIFTPVFNMYYALIFFVIGSVYTFKLFQKNKIQFQMDSDPTSLRTTSFEQEIVRRKRGDSKMRMPDRFL